MFYGCNSCVQQRDFCHECCIGNNLLCVSVVNVVCSGEIYFAECCIGKSLLCVTVLNIV